MKSKIIARKGPQHGEAIQPLPISPAALAAGTTEMATVLAPTKTSVEVTAIFYAGPALAEAREPVKVMLHLDSWGRRACLLRALAQGFVLVRYSSARSRLVAQFSTAAEARAAIGQIREALAQAAPAQA